MGGYTCLLSQGLKKWGTLNVTLNYHTACYSGFHTVSRVSFLTLGGSNTQGPHSVPHMVAVGFYPYGPSPCRWLFRCRGSTGTQVHSLCRQCSSGALTLRGPLGTYAVAVGLNPQAPPDASFTVSIFPSLSHSAMAAGAPPLLSWTPHPHPRVWMRCVHQASMTAHRQPPTSIHPCPTHSPGGGAGI